MFDEEENAFVTFVKSWGFTQCMWETLEWRNVSNTACKHNFVNEETLQGTFTLAA